MTFHLANRTQPLSVNFRLYNNSGAFQRQISRSEGARVVSMIANKDGTAIYYKDWDTTALLTFSHCRPLNVDAWTSI